MILGIMGTPGAFKTAYVVQEQIVKFLRQGRHIYTNIKGINPYNISILFNLDPFDCESKIHFLGRVYRDDADNSFYEDPEQIRRFHKICPPGSVVIIDEAQDYFGCRDFKENFSRDLIPWLSKCRHENYDVIWITPNFDNVDITFRRTSHMFYKMFRLEHLGKLFGNSSKIAKWPTMDTDKKPLATSVFSPKKIVFDCYDSYDMKDVKENRETHNVFLRSPFVWFMIIALGWATYTVLSGNFERSVMKKKLPEKKIEKVENKLIENKVIEEDKINDNICITKTSKIRGQSLYYFNDGSSAPESFGRKLCTN